MRHSSAIIDRCSASECHGDDEKRAFAADFIGRRQLLREMTNRALSRKRGTRCLPVQIALSIPQAGQMMSVTILGFVMVAPPALRTTRMKSRSPAFYEPRAQSLP